MSILSGDIPEFDSNMEYKTVRILHATKQPLLKIFVGQLLVQCNRLNFMSDFNKNYLNNIIIKCQFFFNYNILYLL